MKIKAVEIHWDTDGETVDLPTKVEIPLEVIEEVVADYLSDKYGWCVAGYALKVSK